MDSRNSDGDGWRNNDSGGWRNGDGEGEATKLMDSATATATATAMDGVMATHWQQKVHWQHGSDSVDGLHGVNGDGRRDGNGDGRHNGNGDRGATKLMDGAAVTATAMDGSRAMRWRQKVQCQCDRNNVDGLHGVNGDGWRDGNGDGWHNGNGNGEAMMSRDGATAMATSMDGATAMDDAMAMVTERQRS